MQCVHLALKARLQTRTGKPLRIKSSPDLFTPFLYSIMTYRLTCMVSGKVFYVECLARHSDEARHVARAQYPNARIMGVTVLVR